LKKKLSSEEKLGLNNNEIKVIENYLRIHGNNLLSDLEVSPALEAFLLGYSLEEVADRYPHLNKDKLLLTASSQLWHKKRQDLASSIYDRVRSKLVRSVVEQVDYMTDMLSVVSTEAKETMAAYLKDPQNNPPPINRIKSMKEYRDAIDSLTKLTDHVTKMTAPRDEVVTESKKIKRLKVDSKFSSKEASLLATLMDEDEDD
jgi:hypothetical protein